MNEQALWGLLLIIYVVPFGLWQISEYNTIEARRKLYPGRASEERQDNRFTNLSLLWCVGLVAALAAWKAGWHPIGTAIVLSGVSLSTFAVRFAVRRWNLMSKRLFRFWLAGSVVWVLAIGGWYLVFSRVSELGEEEYFFLAFTPPVVTAFAIAAWCWAVRKP